MRWVPWVLRLIGLSGIALGAALGARLRSRQREHGWSLGQAWSHEVRSFVTHRFNPIVLALGLAGGRHSPWAIVEHVGRITGRVHRTPILPVTAGDHLFVPLTYGADVHWVRNVLAAGHCRMLHRGRTLELDEPAIVDPTDNPTIPHALRGLAAASRRKSLRLHVMARRAGVLAADREREPAQREPAQREPAQRESAQRTPAFTPTLNA